MPAVLAVLCVVLAFLQRPGKDVADTKVHLHVSPRDFLGDVLSAWTPTGDLGHVWAGQYGGYAFPMAPWFAFWDWVGLPSWVAHRLWLALLLFAAATGVVALLRAMWRSDAASRWALTFGGALYVVNPYVTVYLDRTSVALLAYAALPWLLLAVHRGLQDPRGWRWPAVFALVLTSAGGGVNAAVTGWVLVGPVLLVAWALWTGVRAGALRPWLLRMAVLNAVASAWWVVPLLVHARYGLSFLPFSEQPGTIWGTSSLSESLRLMGFWTSYVGVGFGESLVPYAGHGAPLLFLLPVVVAGLLVPAVVFAGARWTLREPAAPFFLALALLGLVTMAAGWPEGTPLRKALTFTYNQVEAVQVLRTTYKAGPLVALAVACLAAMLPRRWLLAPVALLAAWPLVTGRALERQLQFELPAQWRDVAARLDARGDATRALLVPGQLFPAHEWGQTIDAILPALVEDRPVAARNVLPFADLRSTDVQWSTDALLTQRRAVPGQLGPLFDLMGVGDVVTAGDLDRRRGGGLAQVDELPPSPPGARVTVRRVGTGGIVRVLPRGPLTVVDGGAGALTGMAAFGALDPGRPLVHAADAGAGEIAAAGRVVVADTNRRAAFVAARSRGNTGRVLAADEDVSEDGVIFDPWQRPDAETVATYDGVRSLFSPFSPQVRQFPEHRPFAAFDGDERTSWLADRALAQDRHWLEVRFLRPRDVPSIRLLPANDARGTVRSVEIAGRTYRVAPRGWTTLRLGLRRVSSLRVRIADVRRPRRASAGAGGLRELEVPGLTVRERLRLPVVAERALRGRDVSRTTLTYLFERWTADDPFLRGRQVGEAQAGSPRDAQDPERRLSRLLSPPEARGWRASGWVHADPFAGDAALDRLVGVRGPLVASGSSRYQGRPRWRASSAFDGTERPWIAQWVRGEPAWLQWRTEADLTVRRFRLTPVETLRVRFPSRVRLTVSGAGGRDASDARAQRAGGAGTARAQRFELAVAADGLVTLPRAVRGRTFRMDVLAVRPGGAKARARGGRRPGWPWRQAVGIGELRAAGLGRLDVPRRGTLRAPCGSAAVVVDGRGWKLRATADLRAFDAGRPLRAEGCGRRRLPAGDLELRGLDRALVVDRLRLEGAAPLLAVPGEGGRVVNAGDGGNGERTGAQVAADGDSWLVLGETYSEGWRATCDGRDLGAPRVLQGYANAWPISAPGCDRVDFAWTPNDAVRASGWVSLLAAPVLLLLAAGLRLPRRRPARVAAPAGTRGDAAAAASSGAPLRPGLHQAPFDGEDALWSPAGASPAATEAALAALRGDEQPPRRSLRARLAAGPPYDGPRPLPLVRAAGLALVVAAAIAFCFALRAGAVAFPLLTIVFWRAVPTRHLLTAAGALLVVVVPVLYVVTGPTDRGGYAKAYATEHLAAHWVTVAAWVLLAVSTARALRAARRRSAP